ncbi:hypothetical protein ACFL43_00560 [Thermodesulfobacteriota bacterium]
MSPHHSWANFEKRIAELCELNADITPQDVMMILKQAELRPGYCIKQAIQNLHKQRSDQSAADAKKHEEPS